jgi:hypothetical protein
MTYERQDQEEQDQGGAGGLQDKYSCFEEELDQREGFLQDEYSDFDSMLEEEICCASEGLNMLPEAASGSSDFYEAIIPPIEVVTVTTYDDRCIKRARRESQTSSLTSPEVRFLPSERASAVRVMCNSSELACFGRFHPVYGANFSAVASATVDYNIGDTVDTTSLRRDCQPSSGSPSWWEGTRVQEGTRAQSNGIEVPPDVSVFEFHFSGHKADQGWQFETNGRTPPEHFAFVVYFCSKPVSSTPVSCDSNDVENETKPQVVAVLKSKNFPIAMRNSAGSKLRLNGDGVGTTGSNQDEHKGDLYSGSEEHLLENLIESFGDTEQSEQWPGAYLPVGSLPMEPLPVEPLYMTEERHEYIVDEIEAPLLSSPKRDKDAIGASSVVRANYFQCCPPLSTEGGGTDDEDDEDGKDDNEQQQQQQQQQQSGGQEGDRPLFLGYLENQMFFRQGISRHGATENEEEGSESAINGDTVLGVHEDKRQPLIPGEDNAQEGDGDDIRWHDINSTYGSYGLWNGRVRLSWLRLVVTAVTCICAVVSLVVSQQHAVSGTAPAPSPAAPPSKQWKVYPDSNVFFGSFGIPKQNLTNVTYLGEFDSYTECWAACNRTRRGCPSWIWISPNCTQTLWHKQCYAQYGGVKYEMLLDPTSRSDYQVKWFYSNMLLGNQPGVVSAVAFTHGGETLQPNCPTGFTPEDARGSWANPGPLDTANGTMSLCGRKCRATAGCRAFVLKKWRNWDTQCYTFVGKMQKPFVRSPVCLACVADHGNGTAGNGTGSW